MGKIDPRVFTPFRASSGGHENWYYRVCKPVPGKMAGMVGPFGTKEAARDDILETLLEVISKVPHAVADK